MNQHPVVKWIISWWPILLGMTGIWWSLHSGIVGLDSTQQVILEKVSNLEMDVKELKDNDKKQDEAISDLRVSIFSHTHKNGVKDYQ